jgi:phosphomethylpyrimidine synthase
VKGVAVAGAIAPAQAEPFEAGLVSPEEVEKGMAEMSEKFREIGGERYVGAGGREHD